MQRSEKIILREAFLELNNTCNFNCVFCAYPQMTRSRIRMSLNHAKNLIDQIDENFELEHLSLHLYGEPLLHPNIIEIASYAESNGTKINLTTNGALLTDDRLFTLLNSDIWRIVLSVQHTPDKFHSRNANNTFSAEEYFSQIVLSVNSFLAYKIQNPNNRTILEIHYLTTDEIKPNISSVETEGDTKEILSFWNANLNSNSTVFDSTKIFDDETGYRIKLGTDCYLRFKPAITFGNVVGENEDTENAEGYCFFPSSTLVILSNGDLVPCCLDYDGEIILGNAFNDGGIRNVWESEKAKKLRDEFEKRIVNEKRCRQCLGGTHFGSPI